MSRQWKWASLSYLSLHWSFMEAHLKSQLHFFWKCTSCQIQPPTTSPPTPPHPTTSLNEVSTCFPDHVVTAGLMSGAKLNVSPSEFTKSVELMTNLSFLSTLVYGRGGGGVDGGAAKHSWLTGHGRAALCLSPQFEETWGEIAKIKANLRLHSKSNLHGVWSRRCTSLTSQGCVLLPGIISNAYYWLARLKRSNKCNWSGKITIYWNAGKFAMLLKNHAHFNETLTLLGCFMKNMIQWRFWNKSYW